MNIEIFNFQFQEINDAYKTLIAEKVTKYCEGASTADCRLTAR